MGRAATVARKLYLTAFWICATFAIAIIGGVGIVSLHDHLVVRSDFDCFRRQLAKENADEIRDAKSEANAMLAKYPTIYSPSAAFACNIQQSSYDSSHIYSTRSWGEGTNSGTEDKDRGLEFLLSLFAIAPLGILVGLRKWIRWLLRD